MPIHCDETRKSGFVIGGDVKVIANQERKRSKASVNYANVKCFKLVKNGRKLRSSLIQQLIPRHGCGL